MKNVIRIIVALTVISAFVLVNACTQPVPPKAIVNIMSENGEPVEGAMVIVKAPSNDSSHTVIYLADGPKDVADTSWSDKNGSCSYEFRYESIYKVEVTVGSSTDYPYARRGVGVLMLEEDLTYTEEIIVNEQTVFQ